jgi:zinc and cadmium transporter
MDILNIIALSLFASLLALIGGVFFLYNKKASKILEKHAIPFAAGTMITIALLGLVPESFEMIGGKTLWIVLISFVSAYIFENMILATHHHDNDDHQHGHKHEHSLRKGTAGLVIVGDTVHNFIDGVAIGASYLAHPGLGLITTISTFLHEVPHEIGDFGILLKAGWKKKHILLVNIVSALFTVPGALSILYFANSELLTGSMLAVAAGIFLYLGTVDFIPHAFHSSKNKSAALVSLLLGVAIMVGTVMLVPHSHPEGEHAHEEDSHDELEHADEDEH